MSEFLLIDGSYYIFYRYHALIQWWKHANSDVPLPDNPCDSEEFIEKFKKIFISKISEIKKKLKLKNPMIMVAQDCPRENIWRNKIFPHYKKQRKNFSFGKKKPGRAGERGLIRTCPRPSSSTFPPLLEGVGSFMSVDSATSPSASRRMTGVEGIL